MPVGHVYDAHGLREASRTHVLKTAVCARELRVLPGDIMVNVDIGVHKNRHEAARESWNGANHDIESAVAKIRAT
jgi:hypothetical protein